MYAWWGRGCAAIGCWYALRTLHFSSRGTELVRTCLGQVGRIAFSIVGISYGDHIGTSLRVVN